MKQLLLFALAALVTFVVYHSPGASNPLPAMPLLIDATDSTGSCVPVLEVEGGIVALTAKHCVGEPFTVTVGEWDYCTSVLAEHPDRDIALIFIHIEEESERSGIPLFPISLRDVPTGDRLFTAGFPANQFGLTDGWDTGDGTMSAEVYFGASGGAVYDIEGRLVGIIEAVSITTQRSMMGDRVQVALPFLGHYTPLSEVSDWLREQNVVL